MFETLHESGLRIGELIVLKVSAITFKGKTKGRISLIGKGEKPR